MFNNKEKSSARSYIDDYYNDATCILLILLSIGFIILTFFITPEYQALLGFPLVIIATRLFKIRGGLLATAAVGVLLINNGMTNAGIRPIILLAITLYGVSAVGLGRVLRVRGNRLEGFKLCQEEIGELFTETPLGIYSYKIIDGWPEQEYVSPNIKSIFDIEKGTFASYNGNNQLSVEELKSQRNRIPELYQQKEVTLADYKVEPEKGKTHWVQEKQRLVEFSQKEDHVLGMLWDFTEERQVEKKLELLEFSVENIPALIFRVDERGKIEFVNKEAASRLGYDKEELIGENVWKIIPDYEKEDRIKLWQELKEKGALNFQGYLQTKAGETFPVRVNSAYLEYKGKSYEFAFLQDISELKEQEAEKDFILYHDSMTGLYNRRFFEEEFKRLDTERQLPMSIIMADLNGLKIINDSFGHQKGDQVLKAAAKILKNSCRQEDIAARWAGDEFILLLPQTGQVKAQEICQRIKKKTEDFNNTVSFPVSMAVGSATKTRPKQRKESILRQAEEEMYGKKINESSFIKNEILSHLLEDLRAKGHESKDHSFRLASLAQDLGEKIGLKDADLNKLSLLAVVHDIGKATLSDDILFDKSPLTDEDWEEIRKHPERGYRIALSTEKYAGVADEILNHHERWDGTGYPQEIQGNKIPILARILAIVDAYDIMTNKQVYKDRISPEEALKEIRKEAGRQFDPELALKFIEMMQVRLDEQINLV
ncbi:MAG: diguanylate cyclase domain-containing protein [Bacillota bacterium]